MRKIYFAPTCGRSHDLPENISRFLLEEECTYRMTCTESQLQGLDPDIPVGLVESYGHGTEVVSEKVRTIFGQDEVYVSWDAQGKRYYLEFTDLEEALDDLMMGLGVRILLDNRNRKDPFNAEFLEMIYGFPEIDENDRIGEIETDFAPRQEETEDWKKL